MSESPRPLINHNGGLPSPYPIEEQMQYNSYLLNLEELKSLRQKDFSKEELVKMVKESMTKEELFALLMGK